MIDEQNIPYIGQVVDYFPDPNLRFSAMVVDTNPTDEETRPSISLQVFYPDGKLQYRKDVLPVVDDEEGETEGGFLLEGRWGFQQEFPIEEEDEHDEDTVHGTHSNRHVGCIGNA